MSPFRILGVPRNADATQIKRAYARLLRTHRPDDDPVAFQRVHEAYTMCLQEIRWREMDTDDDDANDQDEAVPSTDANPSDIVHTVHASPSALDTIDTVDAHERPDAFDPDEFIDELIVATRDSTVDMQAWLHAHPALYPLDNKDAVAELLVWRLLEDPPPPRRLNPILAFFELDEINERYQRMQGAVERLRSESAVAHGELDLSFVPELRQQRRSAGDNRHWWLIGWLLIVFSINMARQHLGT